MNIKHTNKLVVMAVTAGIAVLPQVTMATEGYFAHGWGARHSALGGAGVASVTDASGQAINPAGLLSIEYDQLNIGAAIFNPNRQYTATGGPGFAQNGTVESDANYFLVPNVAYNSRIDENSAWGISMYGNGGMNTDYASNARPAPDCFGMGGAGVFCGGPTGIDMIQAFVSVSYAVKVGAVTYGIAPIFVYQAFEARGLGAFGAFGFSSDPSKLTNNDHDVSTGFGIKLGLQTEISDGFTFGLSYQPEIDMSEFDDYAGLFADKGDFDIPSNWVVGIAFAASDNVQILLDYKQINYTDVGAVANAGDFAAFQMGPMGVGNQLGTTGGPGFGWDDMTAIKFGLEWKQSEDMTWRFGYAHNDNPVVDKEVTLNILAPGVVTSHYTAGVKIGLEDKGALEFSFVYVPSDSSTGPAMSNPMFDQIDPATGAVLVDTPDQTISVEMDQIIVGVSWTMSFAD